MKKRWLVISIPLLGLLGASGSFAAEPDQLIVVRSSDNTLWKATCTALVCSSFSKIPGLFLSQPTVTWSEHVQRWFVWGTGTDSRVWRASFDRLGAFLNDWSVPVAGSTPSPPAAAGGGISQNAWFTSPNTTSIELTSTITNIKADYVVCPWDGYVLATSSGGIAHNRTSTSGNSFARIYLSETSGGVASTWVFDDLPSGTPTGYTSYPYSITRSFPCPSGGGNKTIYVTGEEGGSATATTTTTVWYSSLDLQYFPYTY